MTDTREVYERKFVDETGWEEMEKADFIRALEKYYRCVVSELLPAMQAAEDMPVRTPNALYRVRVI